MDNNLTWENKQKEEQEMENWKKQILMDPVLNSLFDDNISGQDFLVKKVLPLSHAQIAATYSKLSTLNFQLMQNMQKQVETKTHLVEKAYLQLLSYKQQKGQKIEVVGSKNKPMECLGYLKNFNKKYESIEQSLILWKNITAALHFSKALQTFRVNVNILKTLMRGYNGSQQTINAIKVAKMLRQIIQLSTSFNFDGIKGFQNERVFISSTKSIIHSIGCKNLPRLLHQYCQLEDDEKQKRGNAQKNIVEWINALHNLGTLKQFIGNHFKSILVQLGDKIKKNIQSNIGNLDTNMDGILMPFFVQSSKSLIFLEQKLIAVRKIELSNVPNLFVKFWQKLCEFIGETILWAKKDQQTRNPPKSRNSAIVWKYPLFYSSFSRLCTVVQVYLLQNAVFNSYSFGKSKQRLLVNCLLQLGNQYHLEAGRTVGKMRELFEMNQKHRNIDLEEKKSADQLAARYVEQIQPLFQQSKCEPVYHSLLDKLCSNLDALSAKLHTMKQAGDEQHQHQQNLAILNASKAYIKELLRKYGANYGISPKNITSFKIQH